MGGSALPVQVGDVTPQVAGVAAASAFELRFRGLNVGDQGEILRRVVDLPGAPVGRVRQDRHGDPQKHGRPADEAPGTFLSCNLPDSLGGDPGERRIPEILITGPAARGLLPGEDGAAAPSAGECVYLAHPRVENFRIFGAAAQSEGETDASLDLSFTAGTNVLVGENDSGKTARQADRLLSAPSRRCLL